MDEKEGRYHEIRETIEMTSASFVFLFIFLFLKVKSN